MIPCCLFLINCSKSSKSNNSNCYTNYGYNQTYYNPNTCNGVYGGGTGQICNGQYVYQGQLVMCYAQTRNCAGFPLQTTSGQTVYCQ